MANNNGLNVLDAITAAKLGKGTGGTGGVTKKYVDDGLALKQDKTMSASVTIGTETETTVEGAIGELAGLVPNTAAPATNKLATAGDVNNEEITVTSTTSPVSTASGSLRKIAIFGKSEVVDGSIVSAGEGWATVDLGAMIWGNASEGDNCFYSNLSNTDGYHKAALMAKYTQVNTVQQLTTIDKTYCRTSGSFIVIHDTDYTDATDFKSAMSGVILVYELADPTQGNCIAIKTDNTTGIDGTMATFTTGTPLRGIPDTDVRDVMEWDGSAGEVTKKCGKVRLADLTWSWWNQHPNIIYAQVIDKQLGCCGMICSAYPYIQELSFGFSSEGMLPDKTIYCSNGLDQIFIKNTDYNTKEDFVASLGDAELVYELATPTTELFTASENTSFAALQTYSPQTAVAINDSPEFEVEAYAGTANGQAVAELEEKVQKRIEDKITVSSTLTLSANGWSNDMQTVTFAHDTTKRNVIDITPSEVPAWAAAGVYASAETSAGITFTCATVPETALTFKVTSMEVS